MNTDTFMCSSDEKQTRSPLSLYSEYQRMEIEFRAPHIMPTSHWHGQVEVNVPFDGDVEYLINNEKVNINQGHITLFWACTYSAAIFLIPICISFDTAEKRRYATYLILNRRFSFEF